VESKCSVKIKFYQQITDFLIGKNPPQWLLDILFYRLSGVLAPAALHPHYYYPVFPARQLIFSDARDHKLRLIRSAAFFLTPHPGAAWSSRSATRGKHYFFLIRRRERHAFAAHTARAPKVGVVIGVRARCVKKCRLPGNRKINQRCVHTEFENSAPPLFSKAPPPRTC